MNTSNDYFMNTKNDICFYDNYSFVVSSNCIENRIFTIIYNVKDESDKKKRLEFNKGSGF
jgi:hypothetical protein